jgi:hypothetical protein
MATTILKIQKFVGVVPDEQGYLFSQGHWHRQISKKFLYIWFFLFF